MGTKLHELRHGCFAAALDDEPMFVLLARDPQAPSMVRAWATVRREEINRGMRPSSDLAQVEEAEQCATNMETWRREHDGEWRNSLFATAAAPAQEPPQANVDPRPVQCRNRQRDEGKAYPRSGCDFCGDGGIRGCQFDGTRNGAVSHNVRQEGDEFACSCGTRWDVSDGEAHP